MRALSGEIRQNAAFLSRCRVYMLHPLGEGDVIGLLERALGDVELLALPWIVREPGSSAPCLEDLDHRIA